MRRDVLSAAVVILSLLVVLLSGGGVLAAESYPRVQLNDPGPFTVFSGLSEDRSEKILAIVGTEKGITLRFPLAYDMPTVSFGSGYVLIGPPDELGLASWFPADPPLEGYITHCENKSDGLGQYIDCSCPSRPNAECVGVGLIEDPPTSELNLQY